MQALFKAMLTTGGGTLIGQVLILIVNKILALTLGATGVGFYSLLRQIQDAGTAAGLIGTGGLVQGLAGRAGAARAKLFRAATLLTLTGGVIVSAVLLLLPEAIASFLFDRTDRPTIAAVMLCSVSVSLAVAYSVLSSSLNAVRAIGTLFILGAGGTAVAAILAYPAAIAALSNPHALVILMIVPLLLQIVAAWFLLRRMGWWQSLAQHRGMWPGKDEFLYFAGFFGIGLVLTAATIFALFSIRASIVHAEGLAAAGLFAAAWGIGMHSLSLVISSFGTYLIPTLASAEPDDRCRSLQDATTLVLCATIPMLTGLIILKPLAIRLLFSAEFLPAVSLLQWLLIGNYLKSVSWVMTVPLLATADLRRYFVVEAGWYAIFTPIAVLGIERGGGIESVGIAFAVAFAYSLIVGMFFARARFGFVPNRRSTVVFAGGIALIVASALLSWNSQTVNWMLAFSATALSGIVALYGLTPIQRGKVFRLASAILRLDWVRR